MKCVLNKFRNKDSRTLTNGHLSTTATFFVPADSPYIGSCLNLSTTATSLQQKRLLKRVPNCQNNLSTTASFFSDWWKSQEWSWNLIRMERWWLIEEIVLCLWSIYAAAVSINSAAATILIAKLANLAGFVANIFIQNIIRVLYLSYILFNFFLCILAVYVINYL